MELEIINDSNGSKRSTGNRGSWTAPRGNTSGKIAQRALALKCLLRTGMGREDIEKANHICNALLADADTVATLETAPLEGGCHG